MEKGRREFDDDFRERLSENASLQERMVWANKKYELEQKQASEQILLEGSHARLGASLDKRIMTTAVGALDKFEQAFGHMWGSGKLHLKKTDREKELSNIWQTARRQVLDNAERQKRNSHKELDNYDVKFNNFDLN